eukprot:TRINITY_DN10967_c0_g1_i1.p1 TRINITY_DN10967_c0_g1~~TRINITY_DN10967_c0_g1_i1.p1  ORF type:complete len:390 (+),score=30.44 TRINITY_DN10967_c0_g1_i1:175-1344(+)
MLHVGAVMSIVLPWVFFPEVHASKSMAGSLLRRTIQKASMYAGSEHHSNATASQAIMTGPPFLTATATFGAADMPNRDPHNASSDAANDSSLPMGFRRRDATVMPIDGSLSAYLDSVDMEVGIKTNSSLRATVASTSKEESPGNCYVGGPNRSSLMLLLIEVSFFGCLGVDRLYCEQFYLALLKLLSTMTTLLIARRATHRSFALASICDQNSLVIPLSITWNVADYITVMHACLTRQYHIDWKGFRVSFCKGTDDRENAFTLALINVIILPVCFAISMIFLQTCFRPSSTSCVAADESSSDEESTEDKRTTRRVARALRHSRSGICTGDRVESCSVCLEATLKGDNIQTLPCFHSLHHTCAVQYFQKTRTTASCPVCRMPVGVLGDTF